MRRWVKNTDKNWLPLPAVVPVAANEEVTEAAQKGEGQPDREIARSIGVSCVVTFSSLSLSLP